MKPARLTAREEAFALHVFAGKGVAEAHQLAYGGNGKPEVRAVKASQVHARSHVQARIQKLRDAVARPSILSRQEKLERLAKMVRAEVVEKDQMTTEQLRAMEIDNRAQGHNEPEKLKITGLGTVLQKIRKDARKP